jgi:hypothetical protein
MEEKMIDWQQCDEPIRCLFEGDEGCYEHMWLQHTYCETHGLELEETPPAEHVPVDTSGDEQMQAEIEAMQEFPGTIATVIQCSGCLLAIFGVSFLVVGSITYIKKLFDRDQEAE